MIRFSDTLYFEEWHQNPSIVFTGYSSTYRKNGYKDDAILLESFEFDEYMYWKPYFVGYWNVNSMVQLSSLYHEMYGYDKLSNINIAKNQIDNFLIKAAKLSIFL